MEEKKIQNVLNLWKSMEENPVRRDILDSSTRFRRLLRETKLKKLWLRNENSGKI